MVVGMATAWVSGVMGQYLDWSVESTGGGSGSSGNPSLALTSSNDARISYYDGDLQALRYSQWTGNSWSSEVVDTGQVGMFSSMTLSSNDWPCISYYDAFYKDLKYVEWNGLTWLRTYVDGASSAVGMHSSLALTTNGDPCVTYYDESNKDLKYAWRTLGNWTNQLVDGTNDCGYWSSLALDSQGAPCVAYSMSSGGVWLLKYARWNGEAWDIQTVDTQGNPGLYASMRITKSDRPMIAYYAATPMDLRFAEFDGMNWTQTVVDSWGDTGYWVSLALDSNDQPHVSYAYKPGSGDWDLKYAFFNGAFWETQVVHSPFDTGHETSIALCSDGLARIAFLYYQSQSILLARQDYFFTLSSSTGPNGLVSPWGDVGVRSGGTTSFIIQANSYYHIDSVLQDGVPVGAWGPGSNRYVHIFNEVTNPHVLYASFRENRALLGTPEWWLAYFGWTNDFDRAETNDTDRDGQSGWEEFLGATDPLDSNSWFHIRIEPDQEGQIRIVWPSSSDRMYALETGLVQSAYGLWSNFIAATPALNVQTDQFDHARAKFYRVRAWRP